MSAATWYRFPHFEPPEGPELWVRSWLCPTSYATATYVSGSAIKFTCAVSAWDLPSVLISEWRLAGIASNAAPQPKPLPNTRYRDLLRYKPEANQVCWVRPGSEYAAPFKATFVVDAGGGMFLPAELPGLPFPWWVIAAWRPAS